ncbi:MAG: GTPase ObgE [Tenericutes bacterium HGW-Tenericutes-1]|jgi:GTP-binding protein|nr:MAG: GTPase ObgE [Tenericutes bacterium HGW-Tenericutes-1]
MFVDEVKIVVKSGKGGNGALAFRHEKYMEYGGPSGGDGGKGGSIVFVVDEGMTTLVDLKYRKHIFARAGEDGGQKNMHGADAEDIIVHVPLGTMVFENTSGNLICDLTHKDDRYVIAKGGKGGRGNARFATSRNQAPQIQENGEPAVTLEIRVELKLLADVGLVGFPSVGKSTLISVVSSAKPKIADYPFTTLVPSLGVVEIDGVKSFVMADLPGIIEGASQGLGLGLQFLRHIERTRVIVHLIDMAATHGRDPYEDYLTINKELSEYKMLLAKRPQIVVANKMDLPEAKENLKVFKEKIGNEIEVFEIAAITKAGVKELMLKIAEVLSKAKLVDIYEEDEKEDEVVYRYEPKDKEFNIVNINETTYSVEGNLIVRLLQMTNFGSEESIKQLARRMRRYGVDDKLREVGAKNGDTIRIGEFEFEFVD